jgi:hypothetical protein
LTSDKLPNPTSAASAHLVPVGDAVRCSKITSAAVLVQREMEFSLRSVSELKGVWLFSSC